MEETTRSEVRGLIRKNRIIGVILALVLVLFAGASLSLMLRSIADLLFMYNNELEMMFLTRYRRWVELFFALKNISSVISYIWFGVTLALTILFLCILLKGAKKFAAVYVPIKEQDMRVKKSAYVWLGFLLGSFGAHLFTTPQKKRAYIMLGVGILGMIWPICACYTLGVSFAESCMAVGVKKDEEGYIYLPDDRSIF